MLGDEEAVGRFGCGGLTDQGSRLWAELLRRAVMQWFDQNP